MPNDIRSSFSRFATSFFAVAAAARTVAASAWAAAAASAASKSLLATATISFLVTALNPLCDSSLPCTARFARAKAELAVATPMPRMPPNVAMALGLINAAVYAAGHPAARRAVRIFLWSWTGSSPGDSR